MQTRILNSAAQMQSTTSLSEYRKEFQKVAVAKIKDIIHSSDRAIELEANSEKMTPEQYAARIANQILPRQKLGRSEKADQEL